MHLKGPATAGGALRSKPGGTRSCSLGTQGGWAAGRQPGRLWIARQVLADSSPSFPKQFVSSWITARPCNGEKVRKRCPTGQCDACPSAVTTPCVACVELHTLEQPPLGLSIGCWVAYIPHKHDGVAAGVVSISRVAGSNASANQTLPQHRVCPGTAGTARHHSQALLIQG